MVMVNGLDLLLSSNTALPITFCSLPSVRDLEAQNCLPAQRYLKAIKFDEPRNPALRQGAVSGCPSFFYVVSCLSAVMYFVFVVRSGIFENFFLGCVGRQALLTLPLRLVYVVGGKGKCACRRWICRKCLSAVQ